MDCMSAGKTNIVTRSIHISTEFQEHMDRMSASKAYRLFWLGRYYERVATTLTYLWSWYDRIIDGESPDYAVFCNALDISCNYETAEEFMQDYVFDGQNPESLRTAAGIMLGNGMMLRETIGSRTLSYLELAVNAMESGVGSNTPTLPLQRTIDYIMAFRGCYDDCIEDRNVRNILKCGAGIERLSLFLRLGWRLEHVFMETERLLCRIERTSLKYSPDSLRILEALPPVISEGERQSILAIAENLVIW